MSSADSVSEQQEPSHWRRFWQWLGAVGSTSQQREGNGAVSYQGGNPNGAPDESSEPTLGTEETLLRQLSRRLADEAVAKVAEETKGDAGKPQSPYPQDLVLGPQRYRDPDIWGPRGETTPLTENKEYGEVMKLIDKLDARSASDTEP